MNDKRRPGHAQRLTVRPSRTRLLQGSTKATPRARTSVSSRAHMAPSAARVHRHEDVQKPQDQKPQAQKALTPATRMERRRAIRRRRARIVWVVCGGFCLLVLGTSFPAQALIRQHDAISSASSELDRLTEGNNALQKQADELANPANIAALARSDYGMVSPGQKAYKVLATGGSPAATSLSSGHSSLDQGPVAPGSTESQDLLAGSGAASDPVPSTGSRTSGHPDGSGAQHAAAGLWGRVLNSLEFWR